jgi:hypothetical protein
MVQGTAADLHDACWAGCSPAAFLPRKFTVVPASHGHPVVQRSSSRGCSPPALASSGRAPGAAPTASPTRLLHPRWKVRMRKGEGCHSHVILHVLPDHGWLLHLLCY